MVGIFLFSTLNKLIITIIIINFLGKKNKMQTLLWVVKLRNIDLAANLSHLKVNLKVSAKNYIVFIGSVA